MGVNLGNDELLTTTRTVRRRLDLDRPVDRELVLECLRIAFQAPNGSNQQRWQWLLIDDPEVKKGVAAIYAESFNDYAPRDDDRPDYTSPSSQRISSSVMHLRDNMDRVPVLVVPLVRGRLDGESIFYQASLWGSVLPAVWSFMLALRSRGLGSAWTTIHLHREIEMAELLGIPHAEYTQAGLFPVAYTLGTDFKAADRSSSEETIRWNHW
jgi:nitroreductase